MFSPLSRGKGFHSASAIRRRRRVLKIKIIIFFSIVVLVFVVSIFVSRSSYFRIQKIFLEGNSILLDEEIMRATREQINGSAYFLFPKNNILYFSRLNIEKKLLSKYPEIEKAEVSFKDFQSISIVVKEREPKALWCHLSDFSFEDEEGFQTGSCYLVDPNGLIFRKVSASAPSWFVRFESGVLDNPIGQSVISKDEFKMILFFVEALSKDDLFIKQIFIKEGGVREGELSLGGKIIWNADQNLSAVFPNLKTLIENPDFKGKKDGVLSVEYIDIQNNNKIFYKAR